MREWPSTGVVSKMWLLSCLYSNRFCYQTSRLLTDPGERRAAAVIANKRMHADLRIHFIIHSCDSRLPSPTPTDRKGRAPIAPWGPSTRCPPRPIGVRSSSVISSRGSRPWGCSSTRPARRRRRSRRDRHPDAILFSRMRASRCVCLISRRFGECNGSGSPM